MVGLLRVLTSLMHVLIIDDDEHIRRVLARHLATDGHCATGAGDSKSALTAIQRSKFDFAFVDVDLGAENGVSLAIELLKRCPALRAVMMSGNPQNAPEVARAGLGRLLSKPFDLSVTRALIQRAP